MIENNGKLRGKVIIVNAIFSTAVLRKLTWFEFWNAYRDDNIVQYLKNANVWLIWLYIILKANFMPTVDD